MIGLLGTLGHLPIFTDCQMLPVLQCPVSVTGCNTPLQVVSVLAASDAWFAEPRSSDEAFAALAAAFPHFPSVWLHEIAAELAAAGESTHRLRCFVCLLPFCLSLVSLSLLLSRSCYGSVSCPRSLGSWLLNVYSYLSTVAPLMFGTR